MMPDLRFVVAVIAGAISASLLIVGIWYVVIPSLRAGYRQRLFDIRRNMFLAAANGEIPREHPAYESIRYAINNQLRHAERISFVRVIVMVVAAKVWLRRYETGETYSDRVDRQIATLPPKQHERLEAFRDQMRLATAVYILVTSPLAIATFPVVVVFACVAVALKPGAKNRAMNRMESEAVELSDDYAMGSGARGAAA